MNIQEVLAAYDQKTAQTYEKRFIFSDSFQEISNYEIKILAQILQEIGDSARWLDVACGTGYFLSQFPKYYRSGLDISPAMLEIAKKRNPQVNFVEGNFKEPFLEWQESWDLVTCMWWAYCYADSPREVEGVIANLANWTSKQGCCFLPVCELKNVINLEVDLPYTYQMPRYDEEVKLTGFTWTWVDKHTGKEHQNLVSLSLEHLIIVFQKYFNSVQVLDYPTTKPRKAIIARSKK
jgi:SAM-dependent methyltransferase